MSFAPLGARNTGTVYQVTPRAGQNPYQSARLLADSLNRAGIAADVFMAQDRNYPQMAASYVVTGPLGLEHKAIRETLGPQATAAIDAQLAQQASLQI